MTIRPISKKDKQFVVSALKNLWGSEQIVYSGKIFHAGNLPGFLAEENNRVVGLLTYILCHPEQSEGSPFLQIISINALIPGKGIGTVLLEKVKEVAREKGFQKIIVVTTNDNLSAMEFYKKKGFAISNSKKGAVALSRKLKPEIPLIGENSMPIEDEIEMELIA